MNRDREHSYIPKLKEQLAEGKIDRREFLRTSSLLGLSAGAAYAFAGKICGQGWVAPARAEMPKGGNLRIGVRVQETASRLRASRRGRRRLHKNGGRNH